MTEPTPTLQFTPVDPDRVDKRAPRKTDPVMTEAVTAIHREHPHVSPWFPLDSDEAKAKTMLRKIRAVARTLDRRVITGIDRPTKSTVWALGGPIKHRASNTATTNTVPTPANTGGPAKPKKAS